MRVEADGEGDMIACYEATAVGEEKEKGHRCGVGYCWTRVGGAIDERWWCGEDMWG